MFFGGLESPLDRLIRERKELLASPLDKAQQTQQAQQRPQQPVRPSPISSAVDVGDNILRSAGINAVTDSLAPASPTFGAVESALGLGEPAIATSVATGEPVGATALASGATPGAFAAIAPYAAAPLAAATAYNSVTGIADLLQGRELNFGQEAALALPTFGASFLIDPVRDAFGSGKNDDQRARDQIRNWLGGREGVGEGRTFTSLDGSRQLRFENPPLDPKTDALSAEALSLVNPIAFALGGGHERTVQAMGNILAGSVREGASSQEQLVDNIRGMMNAIGITPAQVYERLQQLNVDENTLNVLMNSLSRVSGLVPVSQGSTIPDFGSLSAEQLAQYVRSRRQNG